MTTPTAEKLVRYHPFQEAGLGEAPYRLAAVISMPSAALCEANVDAYNNAVRECNAQARYYGVHLCSCQFCGMALMNNYVIRDRRGVHFVVGCDCVAKTGDGELMTAAAREQKRHEKAVRAEAAARKREAAHEARMAELQAQRDRNGGLTDYEQGEAQRKAERRNQQQEAQAGAAWLVEVLQQVPAGNGGFLRAMIEQLQRTESLVRHTVSDRCLHILADIYARQASGKKRGPDFEAAKRSFWNRVEGQ